MIFWFLIHVYYEHLCVKLLQVENVWHLEVPAFLCKILVVA